jgi:hypothetical protein
LNSRTQRWRLYSISIWVTFKKNNDGLTTDYILYCIQGTRDDVADITFNVVSQGGGFEVLLKET